MCEKIFAATKTARARRYERAGFINAQKVVVKTVKRGWVMVELLFLQASTRRARLPRSAVQR